MNERFDHETAWLVLAKPQFDGLGTDIKALIDTVRQEAANISQDKNLRLPMPQSLLEAFKRIPSQDLAHAARVVYFYGHWAPLGNELQTDGIYWKFALYADQVLSERLDIGDTRWSRLVEPMGVRLQIHEGMLRLCCSYEDGGTFEEIGFATETNLGKAPIPPELLKAPRKRGVPRKVYAERENAFLKLHTKTVKHYRKTLGLDDPLASPWLTVRHMKTSGSTKEKEQEDK